MGVNNQKLIQIVFHGFSTSYPQNVDNLCISGQIIPKDVEKAYEQSPEIAAVILTSPTYEGIVSNIRQIADVVHAHGGVLIVDEAHGAHLPYANHGAKRLIFHIVQCVRAQILSFRAFTKHFRV